MPGAETPSGLCISSRKTTAGCLILSPKNFKLARMITHRQKVQSVLQECGFVNYIKMRPRTRTGSQHLFFYPEENSLGENSLCKVI